MSVTSPVEAPALEMLLVPVWALAAVPEAAVLLVDAPCSLEAMAMSPGE